MTKPLLLIDVHIYRDSFLTELFGCVFDVFLS